MAQRGPEGDHWAVIVAGSKNMWNYRHQASACRAYQILKNNKVPEDQIIHFSFDDAVADRENPFRGQLFNEPNGEDVYEGCKIDYRRDQVTTDNFIGAITSNQTMANLGQKVLKSGTKSKVFIYIVNHGATGLLAFPNDEYLFADDFMNALMLMKEKGLYEELVIYLDGTQSGSMFNGILPKNISVLAVTATNENQSAFGAHCFPNDVV